MKILFVAPRFHTNQYYWVQSLRTHNHHVSYIVSFKSPFTENYSLLEPIQAHPASAPWPIRLFISLRGNAAQPELMMYPDRNWLTEKIKNLAPEVIIIRDLFSPLSLMTILIARQLKIKTLLYNQSPLEDKEKLSYKLLKIIGITPPIRITPTRFTSLDFNAATNSFYVPLIVSENSAAQVRHYTTEGVPRLLFVGKFTMSRKMHFLMLDALKEVLRTTPVTLTLVGFATPESQEYLQRISEYAKDLGIADRVHIVTNVDPREMDSVYLQHDLFVLPSIDEPFSISPLEAMSYGLPVVVTDTNGARGCIDNGKDGLVVTSGDSRSLVAAILFFCKNSATLEAAGRQALEKIATHFTSKTFLRYLEKALGTSLH